MATERSGRKTGAGGKAGAKALGDEARGAGEAAASPPIGAADDAAREAPAVVGDIVDVSTAAGQAGARRRPRPGAPGASKASSPVKASKAAAKGSKSAPEASKPVSKSSKPVSKSSKPVPKSSKPVPKSSKPAPKSSKPAPKSSKPVPKAAQPALKASAPTKMKRSAPASLGRAAAVQAAGTAPGPVEASSGKAPGARPTNVASEDASASAGARKALKLVRDSYTMPRVDYALFEVLKARALAFQRPTKKSELLRAGLQVLAALDAPALEAVLGRLVAIKTGRPRRR